MVKPVALWNFFHECDLQDAEYIGRICLALAGKYDPSKFSRPEFLTYRTILKDNDDMDERIDEMRDKWRNTKRNSRGKFVSPSSDVPNCPQMSSDVLSCPPTSSNVHQCPQLSTDVLECPPMSSDVHQCHRTSVRPSVRPSNNINSGGGYTRARTHACEKKTKKSSKRTKSTTPSYPSSFQEVKDYFESIQLIMFNEKGVLAKFLELTQNGWHDGNDEPILDWKTYMQNVANTLNLDRCQP